MEQLDWRDAITPLGLEVGPSVRADIAIAAAPAHVWGLISEPGHLKQCHPFCDKVSITSWPGASSVDSITYYSGITYKRNFVRWVEGQGYDLELGERPNLTARVHWRIVPQGEMHSHFSIEVMPYLRASLGPDKKRIYLERLFGDVLQHYLQCVVRGVKHKVETGEDVIKDQFGKNLHYSD